MHVIDFLRELRTIPGVANCGAMLLDEPGSGEPMLVVQASVSAIKEMACLAMKPEPAGKHRGNKRVDLNRLIEQDMVGAMQQKVGEMLKAAEKPRLRGVPPSGDVDEFAGQG